MNSNDGRSDRCDYIAPEYVPKREAPKAECKRPEAYSRSEYGLHLTPKQAISQLGNVAVESMMKEIE